MTLKTKMEGTEKQIKWATDIKSEIIGLLRPRFGNPDAVEAVLHLETSAEWWIEHRGYGETDILKQICAKYPEAIAQMSK